jgi:hypothetical protein
MVAEVMSSNHVHATRVGSGKHPQTEQNASIKNNLSLDFSREFGFTNSPMPYFI